eukprot:2122171-Alexandrium_andersonii.AAC.1
MRPGALAALGAAPRSRAPTKRSDCDRALPATEVQGLDEQEELSAAVDAARERMVALEAEAERARQEYHSTTARASWAGLGEP